MHQSTFEQLDTQIQNHKAVKELQLFGQNLLNTPLDNRGLKLFFGTLWAFFREIPTGISALALHISDDWMKNENEFEGTAKAAPVLYANVDEFGLSNETKLLPTHHQLFIKLVKIIGLSEQDVLANENVLSSGKSFGKITREFYRNKTVGHGIGFHLASEFTSSIEFQYFLDGFKQYSNHYNLIGDNKSALAFFHIHTLVEPIHLSLGKQIACTYIAKFPEVEEQIHEGAMVFMDAFYSMFAEMNTVIFCK